MKVDFNQLLKTLDGEPLKKTDNKTDATLAWICIEGLLWHSEETLKLSGEEKLERFKLAKKIKSAEQEMDISVEQVVKLKKCIALAFGSLVTGQAWELLDSSKDSN